MVTTILLFLEQIDPKYFSVLTLHPFLQHSCFPLKKVCKIRVFLIKNMKQYFYTNKYFGNLHQQSSSAEIYTNPYINLQSHFRQNNLKN